MEARDDVRAEYTDLRAVFHGDLSEATVMRAALAARGFETFIPSEYMKVTDPFYTGANALVVELLARTEDYDAVTLAVQELREASELEEGSFWKWPRVGWLLLFLFVVLVPAAFMAFAFLRELLF